MTLYHAITDHNGNVDGGPMIEIKLPAPSATDALHTGLSGFAGAVLLAIAILTILSACSPAHAGFDEGYKAFRSGDWETANAEMRPLADAGNPKAQIAMGLLYARGLGVSQDWMSALYWFIRAESSAAHPVIQILARENRIYSERRLLA